MSQSFDFASNYTHTQLNGSDCSAIYLNGTRIWERYTAQRQVWVSSGYYQTSEQLLATYQGGTTSTTLYNGHGYWAYSGDYFRVGIQAGASLPEVFYSIYARGSNRTWNNTQARYVTQYIRGTRRYVRGSYRGDNRKSTKVYQLKVYDQVTSWVDTSSYQTEDYTAYYY